MKARVILGGLRVYVGDRLLQYLLLLLLRLLKTFRLIHNGDRGKRFLGCLCLLLWLLLAVGVLLTKISANDVQIAPRVVGVLWLLKSDIVVDVGILVAGGLRIEVGKQTYIVHSLQIVLVETALYIALGLSVLVQSVFLLWRLLLWLRRVFLVLA